MKDSVKSVTVLFAICFIVSALLAAVYFVTGPIIEQSEKDKATAALLTVMPDGTNFVEISDISTYNLPSSITNVYSENGGGYVFRLSVTGYAPGFVIMCGVDNNGIVTGATCVSSSETLGAEKVYGDHFIGADISSADGVDDVSGSTAKLTMKAYKNAVKDALAAFGTISESKSVSFVVTVGNRNYLKGGDLI